MNGVDILRYSYGEVQTAVANLPDSEWYMPGGVTCQRTKRPFPSCPKSRWKVVA